jgi:hypothetical protein
MIEKRLLLLMTFLVHKYCLDKKAARCCYAYIRQCQTHYQSRCRLNLLNLLSLYSNSVNADLV